MVADLLHGSKSSHVTDVLSFPLDLPAASGALCGPPRRYRQKMLGIGIPLALNCQTRNRRFRMRTRAETACRRNTVCNVMKARLLYRQQCRLPTQGHGGQCRKEAHDAVVRVRFPKALHVGVGAGRDGEPPGQAVLGRSTRRNRSSRTAGSAVSARRARRDSRHVTPTTCCCLDSE
jgi:hypothetical protein